LRNSKIYQAPYTNFNKVEFLFANYVEQMYKWISYDTYKIKKTNNGGYIILIHIKNIQ